MSEPPKDEDKVLDGVPVLAQESAGADVPSVSRPRALAVQLAGPARTAAAAAGGIVAGAALLSLAHRRQARRLAGAHQPRRLTRRSGARGVTETLEIVSTRSLLVDVHLLGAPGSDR